jgi:putative membrane protein
LLFWTSRLARAAGLDRRDHLLYKVPDPGEKSARSSAMNYLFLVLKGVAMGAANVIPGVSGGTIAFITGIYERLLSALKAFDLTALRLLLRLDFKGLSRHIDLPFLVALGVGVLGAILGLAGLLEGWFESHPTLVWSFFFGLILTSVLTVGKMVGKWTIGCAFTLLIGAGLAMALAFLPAAQESSNPLYLVLCGVAAMCSMIIPGISGSFVLLLMGNYLLVLRAVKEFDLGIIAFLGIGAISGLLALSHLLSWLFHRFHDIAVSLITGFVFGSLLIIWPWKFPNPDRTVERINSDGEIEEKVMGYLYQMPDFAVADTWVAIAFMVAGAVLLLIVDRLGRHKGMG